MENTLEKLLEYTLFKPSSIIVALFLCIASSLSQLPTTSTTEEWNNFYIWAIFSLILFITYVIVVFIFNKLPKAKKNEIGILIIINASNKKTYDETIIKFQDAFSNLFLNLDNVKITTKYIQYHLTNKYRKLSHEEIKILLHQTQCILKINIIVNDNDVDMPTKYEMIINSEILHKKYSEQIENKFKWEFSNLIGMTKPKIYNKENKIEVLNFTSTNLSYVCQYILGLAMMLDKNIDTSIKIYESLYNSIKLIKYNIEPLNSLKNILPFRCFEAHILKALEYSENFSDTDDSCFLILQEQHLQIANQYIPNTYPYCLDMATICFLKNRDIQTAEKHLSLCKVINNKGIWRYSIAFISAYKNENANEIYRKYIYAFNVSINLEFLIDFVGKILEKEPDKTGLNFSIGLLLLEAGDESLGKKYINTYLTTCIKNNNLEETLTAINKKYNINIKI